MTSLAACTCGARLAPGAQWCTRCLTPRPDPPLIGAALVGPTGSDVFDPRAAVAEHQDALPPKARVGRFGKTDVSFGLTGRIVLTVLLLLPLLWFIYLLQWLIAAGGLLIYAGVVLPLMLRDVWRRVPRRHRHLP